MQMTFRATQRLVPSKDETIIRSPEEARQVIADLRKKISHKHRKPSAHEKAVWLCAIATLYEALGDPGMLEAAKEAYAFCKSSNTAALVAVALHHFGRIKESLEWYERSWKYTHEPGWEIDIGYSGALLFNGQWEKAWPLVKQLKKRMVYALYLPFWDGKPCKEVSVISEGGFGDLIHNSRFLPMVGQLAEKVVVYLPPYFFEQGFADLAKHQSWFPEIRPMEQCPKDVPTAGFFDLPAIFNTTPELIPDYPDKWAALPEKIDSFAFLRSDPSKPRIGFCYGARAMETPLVAPGIYRTLTDEQANRIIRETERHVNWFSLQKDNQLHIPGLHFTELKSWEDTAGLIHNLDAVVTVDTGVAHLAAAMGKPTWVILSGATDWKFGLEGDSCPWYPSMKLFRNDDLGFENSVTNVISSLKGLSEWRTAPQLLHP